MDIFTAKRLLQFIFALLVLFAGQSVFAASAGETAYQQQRYKDAFKLLTDEANSEVGHAQYLLGTLYLDGLGVARSPQVGVIWLERAVANRHAGAAHMLGKIYMSGMGVQIDVTKAIHYMELADQLTPNEQEEECD